MAVKVITKEKFEKEVLKSEQPVLLDFWASWCVPCGMMSPVIDEASDEMTDVKFGKVNVDEEPELSMSFGIDSIPTLIVIKNGEIYNKSVGVISKDDVKALFD